MFFALVVILGVVAVDIALLLSSKIQDFTTAGFLCRLNEVIICSYACLNGMNSLRAKARAIYSASVVLKATSCCNFKVQCMGHPLRDIT